MNNCKLSWRKTAFGTLLASITVMAVNAHAIQPEDNGLFSTLPGKAQGRLPAQAIAAHSRSVKVNYSQLRRGRFVIKLPDGTALDAVRDVQKEMGKNKFAWVGHANGDKGNRVVIGVSGDAVAATFAYNGRLFKLEPRPDGSHVVSEVAPGDPAPELDPIPVADTTASSTADPGAQASADGGTVIDVMVAYTPKVQALFGTAGAEALIVQAVAEANQAYANSGINPRLNLVHAVLTNYTESGSMNTDLSRLRGSGDGYMDELHGLRDSHGADLVSLLEHEPQYCGLAYRMTSLSASFATNAFSVVHQSCATGYYSFAHELGHNQGAHHDPANASGAMYPYAYGHQEPTGAFRTVMAYNCSGGCTRVDYFSNPDILRNGAPTGVVGYTDNARTLNNTAATIAAFRQLPSQFPPTVPYGLEAATASYNAIELNWVDASADESGFKLERSENGLNFTEVASLPTNSTGYLDDTLAADTLYSYRVRAWNSAGNSGFSDVAVAATDAPPPLTDQAANSDLPVAGSVSGTYQSTWSDDETYQRITERQSGGKKNTRYGYLEHKWGFQVQPGSSVTLFADARASTSADSFTFSYSTNNSQYVEMFTVSGTSASARQFTLPPTTAGTVYVRVRDNVRQAGTSSSHSIEIDQLMIRSENGASMPVPGAPEGLFASADGPEKITIDWIDSSDTEYGFTVERSAAGSSQWQQVDSTGANTRSYTDTGLQADTSYEYRVKAFNSSGESDYSNTSSARTDTLPKVIVSNIELSASGYKTKGKQAANLSWSGTQDSSVDIYRNGSKIKAAASNNGSYNDNIGAKGGGSYRYEICAVNSSNCSNTANVVF